MVNLSSLTTDLEENESSINMPFFPRNCVKMGRVAQGSTLKEPHQSKNMT